MTAFTGGLGVIPGSSLASGGLSLVTNPVGKLIAGEEMDLKDSLTDLGVEAGTGAIGGVFGKFK